MRDYFPTADLLVNAPVFDVAGVIIELLQSGTSAYVVGSNSISAWTKQYDRLSNEQETRVRQVISEAWSWLHANGLIAEEITPGGAPNKTFITRAGKGIANRAEFLAYTKASLLPTEILNADIAQVSLNLFLGGHFDAAVAAAFIQVEVLVRTSGGFPDDTVGVKLMRQAFHHENGPLTIPEDVPAEREAAEHLFAGAIGYYKNPFSHRVVGIAQAVQAASLILVANELYATANIHALHAEERKAAGKPPA